MTEVYLIEIGRKAFITTLLVSGPILGIGMLVGLIISILQAVTSIQEMTITFVPKILAVMVTVAIFGPWMLSVMLRFTYELFTNFPGIGK
jgi:flagellar biosynthetic protein FliQ